ncbi:MAG: hypothetical protein LAN70_15670 [Acidobacteriia bacterium]|nr:hypothetical protein [Terriglobia bacterium]
MEPDAEIKAEIERLTQAALLSLERSGEDLERIRTANQRMREESNAKQQN